MYCIVPELPVLSFNSCTFCTRFTCKLPEFPVLYLNYLYCSILPLLYLFYLYCTCSTLSDCTLPVLLYLYCTCSTVPVMYLFNCTSTRVGHRVLLRSERIVLLCSFKEYNVLLRSFLKFLATYETQKNDAFFS